MRLAVIGSGYVGLVAGACFSNTGNDVAVVDVDHRKIDMLKAGKSPIYEPGLEELIQRNSREQRLTFTTDLASAVAAAEVVVLAVGTPSAEDGTVDMRQIEAASKQVARAMSGYTVVITKSTVPVGTARRVTELMAAETEQPFDYVSNPEFLKEGAAVGDFLKPDRVIVGLTSTKALKVMRHLYAPFMRRADRLLVMDPASAELTKYACNCMLATRISFMNEMARLCDHFGANIDLVRNGMGRDQRIGPDFLYASLGYGGSCFPKDVKALISFGKACERPSRVVEAVHSVNEAQREHMFRRIADHFGGELSGRKLAMWGMAFKAGTDDVRESPAVALAAKLLAAGASLAVHDPQAADNARTELGQEGIEYCPHMYQPLDGADALVVCTEWQEYRSPDFGRMTQAMKQPLIFDGRNLYNLDWMADLGFTYVSVGRPTVQGSSS